MPGITSNTGVSSHPSLGRNELGSFGSGDLPQSNPTSPPSFSVSISLFIINITLIIIIIIIMPHHGITR